MPTKIRPVMEEIFRSFYICKSANITILISNTRKSPVWKICKYYGKCTSSIKLKVFSVLLLTSHPDFIRSLSGVSVVGCRQKKCWIPL